MNSKSIMDSILVESAEILRTFNASWNHILGQRCDSRDDGSSIPRGGASVKFGSGKDCNLKTNTQGAVYTSDEERVKMAQDRPGNPSFIQGQRYDISPPQEASVAKLGSLDGRRGRHGKERLTASTSTLHEPCESSLTMDVIGCLPDNIQQAIKRFSIKKETEHLILSFPFMTDILRKACFPGNESPRARHMIPMILCDHGLTLTNSHRVIVTLAPDIKRLALVVVQLTIYRNGTSEGLRQHYTHLLSAMLKDLPTRQHICFPRLVILDASTDPVMVASLCDKIRNSLVLDLDEKLEGIERRVLNETLRNAGFTVTGINSGIFQQAVEETSSVLTQQDRHSFLALVKHLLSEKCSSQEFKKTEKLLGNHELLLVPTAIHYFWMVWGHELVKPSIFPVAKVIWDCEKQDESTGSSPWRSLFSPQTRSWNRCKDIKQGGVMKGLIQGIVQRLKSQVTPETANETKKDASLCVCVECIKERTRNGYFQTLDSAVIVTNADIATSVVISTRSVKATNMTIDRRLVDDQ